MAAWIDRKLPPRLQTVVSLYGSWLEQVRASPARATTGGRLRRIVRVLLVDAAAVTAVVIGASVATEGYGASMAERFAIEERTASLGIWAVAAVVAVPFCVGLLRNARAFGIAVASAALPTGAAGRPDLSAAPRRAFVAFLQLGVLTTSAPADVSA